LGPVNIGSDEMVSINQLAEIAINISQKNVTIENLEGNAFFNKYGFKCPIGVRGRNSDNNLFFEKMGWKPNKPLVDGMRQTYEWINEQLNNDKKSDV
jgi:nucleoside-diphosphate-sugar epimerase